MKIRNKCADFDFQHLMKSPHHKQVEKRQNLWKKQGIEPGIFQGASPLHPLRVPTRVDPSLTF